MPLELEKVERKSDWIFQNFYNQPLNITDLNHYCEGSRSNVFYVRPFSNMSQFSRKHSWEFAFNKIAGYKENEQTNFLRKTNYFTEYFEKFCIDQ